MTALIGVVVDGIGYLGVDQQQSLGNASTLNVKVVRHPNRRLFFCASGAPMIAYPATLVDPPVDAFGGVAAPGPGWADAYWRQLLALGHPPLDRDGDLDGNLLVLTPGAITLIGGTGWPTPIGPEGIALGSAGDFALGAFHGYRDACPEMAVEEALSRAITVACRLSTSAGGAPDVVAL